MTTAFGCSSSSRSRILQCGEASGRGSTLAGAVILWLMCGSCSGLVTAGKVDLPGISEAHRVLIYSEGRVIADSLATEEEEAAIQEWLCEAEEWRWKTSYVTFAPATMIYGKDYNLNLWGRLVVANLKADGEWRQVVRAVTPRDEDLDSMLRRSRQTVDPAPSR